MSEEIRRQLGQASAAGSAEEMLYAGAAALQSNAQAEAVAPVREALRRHPEHPQLWHLLGLLHRDLEQLEEAVQALGKAAELAPADAAIVHALACVRLEAGLPAASYFERARRLAPADVAIVQRHAAAHVAEGRNAAAIALLDEELRRNPAWLPGQSALARIRWTNGDGEGFADGFERALQAAPKASALWGAYLRLLLHAQLYERALTVVGRARAAVGAQAAFDSAEAVARAELGDLAAAEPIFARLSGLTDVSFTVQRLRFLLRAGRTEEAAGIAGREAPRDPSNQIWPYASIAWRLLGDPRWEWLEGDPAFVGVYDIADRLPPLDALAERLRSLHRTLHHPVDQTLRGGTQTEGHLFPRIEPEIRRLREAVVEAVERHVAQLPPPSAGHPLLIERRAPIRFSGSWSVRLTGGGRHVNHVHPAGWFSSALYVALPGEGERGASQAGWLSLGEASELGVDLPPIRVVEPKPGRLVLFPSTMWHGTRPFDAGERLTVAFDVARPR